jgi:hypothetical protein
VAGVLAGAVAANVLLLAAFDASDPGRWLALAVLPGAMLALDRFGTPAVRRREAHWISYIAPTFAICVGMLAMPTSLLAEPAGLGLCVLPILPVIEAIWHWEKGQFSRSRPLVS